MKLQDPRKIIIKPVITEKTTTMREKENVFTFRVHKNATKENIKKSIEKLFSVNVIDVRIVNLPGKMKRRGRFIGKTSSEKRAMIKLAKNQTIPIFEGLA